MKRLNRNNAVAKNLIKIKINKNKFWNKKNERGEKSNDCCM